MLNRVTCYFLLVIVLMFGADMCILLTQTIVTSYQTAYYAEKISVQGGLLGNQRVLPGEINSKTQCSSCLTNSDISTTFQQTMGHFGVSTNDWEMAIINEDSSRQWVHQLGTTPNGDKPFRLKYMSVNELYIASRFIPKLSRWLWDGALIQKQITFVSEYIER